MKVGERLAGTVIGGQSQRVSVVVFIDGCLI